MQRIQTLAFTFVVAILFNGLAVAQSPTGKLTVNPGILTRGGDALIEIDDATRAGDVIQVKIHNGDMPNSNPKVEHVEITLDANGKGSVIWSVPDDPDNWSGASFSAPGCNETTRMIAPD